MARNRSALLVDSDDLFYLRDACLTKFGGFLTGLHIINIFESILKNLITYEEGKLNWCKFNTEHYVITVTCEPCCELNHGVVNKSDNCKRN